MLYYYANSGHKIGMERVRRGAALLKKLAAFGVETQLLVNDFRAGLLAKELGLDAYVTIESILDIDAIADTGDSIIIDSPEDDKGRLIKYCSDFAHVWRFEHDSEDSSVYGEKLIRSECKDETCINALIIDDLFFENKPKNNRTLFFLGDADYDKMIINNASFFKAFDMELLLGNYFFVKYESDLAKLFDTMHEPEEYTELITSSSCVVTASSQTALEAKVSGAKVILIQTDKALLYPKHLLEEYGIVVVEGFDIEKVTHALDEEVSQSSQQIEKYDVSNFKI
ncbi:MAG: hypothetical protein RL113_1323 [Pseudomonadota bacterium]|jgi:spore coat polysaccharide biosynthesis predicted glycosyltransferase SpsG